MADQTNQLLAALKRLEDNPHEFDPSTFTTERRSPNRPACAVCGNAERATIHGR